MKKENLFLILILLLATTLRFLGEGISPPGFNADEASFGYSAYSILKTGRDEFGNFLPLTLFSFGDYKTPLYAYLAILPIAVFGLNEFATRFPARLCGVLTVFLTYKLSRVIFRNEKIALLAALFLTLSPWHLLQSRASIESTVSLFFFCLGLYLFTRWRQRKTLWLLLLAASTFALTFYAYNSGKLTTPLLLLVLLLLFWRDFKKEKRQLFIGSALGLIIILPLLVLLLKSQGKSIIRAKEISVFADPQIELTLWETSTFDGPETNVYLTRFFHNKPLYYFLSFLRRYFQHFDLNFLFWTGDPHERFRIPFNGLINWSLLPFLFLGVYGVLIKKENPYEKFLLFGILLPSVVSSLAVFTPNSLHMLESVVPYNMLAAYGVSKIRKKAFLLIFAALFLLSTFELLYGYFYFLPGNYQYARFWSYGYKRMVKKVTQIEENFKSINFYGGHASIFLSFYKKYDPLTFQQEVKLGPVNKEGFQPIASFANYNFKQEFHPAQIEKDSLYVAFEDKIADDFLSLFQEVDRVAFPKGEVAFRILKVR